MNSCLKDIYTSNQTKEDFFLRIEYCKRHFEEFSSGEEFNKVISVIHNLEKEYKPSEVRECICRYDRKINSYMYKPSINIQNVTINFDIISFLYDISKKYKVYASDVIYLTDMKNLLDRLRNKDFDLPFFDPFDDENDKEYFFEKYGCHLIEGKDDKTLIIHIDFNSKYEKQSDLILQLNYEICIFKLCKGIYLSDDDKEILNKISSADKTESYRTNSFYKRIIGLYTWDILRENRKTSFTDIRNRIVSEKLYKYNKKICSLEECKMCSSNENCLKSFIMNYKIAAYSIKNQKTTPTSETPEMYKPTGEHYLERCPLEVISKRF